MDIEFKQKVIGYLTIATQTPTWGIAMEAPAEVLAEYMVVLPELDSTGYQYTDLLVRQAMNQEQQRPVATAILYSDDVLSLP